MDPIQPGAQQAQGTKKNLGPIIGVIVIIILLVIAALYMWGEKLVGPSTDTGSLMETIPAGSNMDVGAADEPLSTSDDLNVIEGELTNTGTVEVDLSGLE